MGPIDARASGQFKIGETTINRLGYGAMRLTGPGIWGAPSDRGAALATLRRLYEIGVNFNLMDRGSEPVLAYCAANNIGFIPWFPLEAGELTRPGGLVDRVAKARGATAGQVALAWLLQRSPVILPIPGTVRVAHLEQNVAASSLSLTSEEVAELDTAA